MSAATVRRSKRLSWLLRHGAIETGLTMDDAGWAPVDEVLALVGITRAQLLEVVATNDKGRLQLDGERLRACQGHSLDGAPVTREALEGTWRVITPDSSLWHGTSRRALDSITAGGLTPRERSHVHLASCAGSRVGKRARVDVLLEISPARLAEAGLMIFEAPNGVILVRHVPPSAIIATHEREP